MTTAARISFFTSMLVVPLLLVLFHDIHLILAGTGWSPAARALSLLLLLVTTFGVIQFVSYADHLLRSLYVYTGHSVTLHQKMAPKSRVAVFIPTYNEEPGVVESCVRACTSITYPDFSVYIIDDSSDPHIRTAMEEISHRYNIHHVRRDHREGFKAGAINHALSLLDGDVQYLLVIDADQRVKPAILTDLIPVLEADLSISFVQTPQFVRSEPKNPISATFSYQQHIYNKHVCRGLSVNRATMLTGSNCIFRISHLLSIGGMDERSIAEDIATAFLFHARGYRGAYIDAVYAEGMAPPNLAAYFTQQLRWAYGNTRLLGTMAGEFVTHPRGMSPIQWLEFAVIASAYMLGGMNVALFLFPVATLIFGIYVLPVWLPVVFAVVFSAVIVIQVVTSTRERHYSLRDLAFSQAIFNALAFVYARAIWYAISGKRLPFVVTPKVMPAIGSRVRIAPVLVVISAILVSMLAGIVRLLIRGPDISTAIPLFWAGFTLLALLSFIVVWRRDGRRMTGEQPDPDA